MKREQSHINKNSGFSLVEILVSIAVFGLFVSSIINLSVNSSKYADRSVNNERAASIAQQTVDILRNLKDDNFSNLADVSNYGISSSSNQWILSSQPDELEIFTREVSISTVDPNKKKVDVKISWNDRNLVGNSYSLSTYFTNWRSFVAPVGLTVNKNVINYFSTKTGSDFAPYMVGTTTVTLGQVSLFSPGTYIVSETTNPNYTQSFSGDCDSTGQITLSPGDAKICQITNEEKYSTLTVNKVVVGGTKTASDFAPYKVGTTTVIDGTPTKFPQGTFIVTETLDPEYVASYSGDCNSLGSITLAYGNVKTCQITNNYLTWQNPNSLTSSLNLSGTNNGLKVQKSGSYLYIIRADGTSDFVIVNVSDPSSPVITGSLTLLGIPDNVYVSGNYAYAVSSDDNQELQIINISNPASPVLTGTLNLAGTGNGQGIYVNGSYAYVGRVNGGASGDFHIVNVSNPASPTLVSSLNTTANSYEIAISGNYAYVSSSDDNQELKVIDISNPVTPSIVGSYNAAGKTDAITIAVSNTSVLLGQGSIFYKINISNPLSPTLVGSLNAGGIVNDISGWDSKSYAFLATSNGTLEMKVVDFSGTTPSVVGYYGTSGPLSGIYYDIALNKAFAVGVSDTEELIVVSP